MPQKRVLLLGATGSIGANCLDILENFPNLFKLIGFSVNQNIERAKQISKKFNNIEFCSTTSNEVENKFQINTKQIEKLIEKTNPDIVVNGIAGSAGLKASVKVLDYGIDLALANKETIVNAGYLIRKLAEKNTAKIIPVDSEHAAIFNLINAHKNTNISKIIITASGGAFRNYTDEDLKNIQPQDALKHPTWNMGGKITIDSASLANKALEVIEAVKLFDIPSSDIIVTVHPQSIVHSMVQLTNGEVYAQMSPPDMRNPIFNALTFPKIPKQYLKPLDFSKAFKLEFEPPRLDSFPMLKLGFFAAKNLALYPLAFNCANEEAVEAFVTNKIKFTDIPIIVEKILAGDWSKEPTCFKEIYSVEEEVRKKTKIIIKRFNKTKN